ncbi:YncE family protein [Rhodococcus spongiicola]|uniref:YncE family protein n=1 Tax=Rhodococcus spongiicola TaxID=2487352 RepID=A0A438B122_9NOCA|nr:YncE family protein [Rhodococcus spongiicola]RVW04653.1 YncE family protein [Rhodococcus spongiicola]
MPHNIVDPCRRRGTPGSGPRIRRRYAAGVTAALAAGLMLTTAPTAHADAITHTFPGGIADFEITPDGTQVYLTHPGTDPGEDTVSVIDTATNTITDTIDVGNEPRHLAITPDSTRVYVANEYGGSISVIDTATNTVTDTIDVGRVPYGLAITPDGTQVYVPNSYDDTVSVIDTTTNTVTTTIDVGGSLQYPRARITPDGALVRVSSYDNKTVVVIDTTTNTLTDAVPVFPPYNGEITPDGTRAYFSGPDSVVVKDPTTGTVIERIELSCESQAWAPWSDYDFWPNKIRITPDGTQAYILYKSSVEVIAIGQDSIGKEEPLASLLGSSASLGAYGSMCSR